MFQARGAGLGKIVAACTNLALSVSNRQSTVNKIAWLDFGVYSQQRIGD